MSAWDRSAALERYAALFSAAEDEEALAEELGSPTKQAIELARTYVPTAPSRRESSPAASGEDEPEQLRMELEPAPVPEQPEPVYRTRSVLSVGALAAYLIPVILIGLPVTLALIGVGLPILAVGGALIVETVKSVLSVISALTLVSDVLMTLAVGLLVSALGLLLLFLGLWISISLSRLWVEKVLIALGRRLCVKEVAVS